MQGRRVYPKESLYGWLPDLQPGDYGRAAPHAMQDGSPLGDGFRAIGRNFMSWQVCLPNGHLAGIAANEHPVIEHEDGTVSITRPIESFEPATLGEDGAVKAPRAWRYVLEKGIWRER